MQESSTLSTDTVLDLIRSRWSPKAYSNRPVERERLRSVFEAARWAASSMNEQPWSFLVAARDEPEQFERLTDCLAEGNAVWARHAPVLIIQATAAGLFVHSMAGFSASRAVELFEIPDGYEPIAMHTLGYLGDPSDTPEEIVDGDPARRKRHTLEEFVFTGKWGTPSDLI